MTRSPEFTLSEAGGAQLQTLHTLSALGWRYFTRAEADRQRGYRRTNVLLESVLAEQLSRINRIRRDDRSYPFSEANVQTAVQKLRDVRFDGLLRTNEAVTDLLQLGTALLQTAEGLNREWPFFYVDWQDWRANAFHMTTEFPVDWPEGASIRPDIVLFVNGIPWCVIEVKSSQERTEQGISQQLRNQKPDLGAPNLFFSAQLLIAANPHAPRYGTVATPAKLWSAWKEAEDEPGFAEGIVNRPLDELEERAIFKDFALHRRRHAGLTEGGRRWPTALDELLVALCRPERLLDLARRFTLFDGPVKKVARHQQMFAVKSLLARIAERDARGRRKGGVVWHTQGSGKSLTMVMLGKALALAVPTARIVLVTDRTDLDDQIEKTFKATGLSPQRARTGEHLVELIEDKAPVVTTLIHKFRAALNKRRVIDEGDDVFVLVDESHRSQYGDLDSLHDRMRAVFPNACLIGFTGTPIAKKERNTFLKFGDLVRPVYSMRDAVGDQAVVPLLYEGRHIDEDVDEAAIDAWFDRVTRDLTDEQKVDLKRRMSRPREMMGVAARLKCIAFDVSQHFAANFKELCLKGQLAAPSKRDAITLKRLLDEFGEVISEVVISAPDQREGEKEIDEETDDVVLTFWRRMMDRHGGEEAYNKNIIEAFKGPGDPDLVIVVDKLLTGFDAPRNTVLYLAKPLREHGLLQAIARVNRVFDEEDAPPKPFGYVIDYCGVLKDLSEALSTYDALQGFDEGDLAQALTSISSEAEKLPDDHAALLDLFMSISNVYDEEAYARALAEPDLRKEFYDRLSAFSRALTVAVASRQFVESTPPERLVRWKADLKRFTALRQHVRIRYADAVEWKDYENRVRTLLNEHISAYDVTTVVEPLNIFDDAAIEVARGAGKRSDASVADEIAHATVRVMEEKWEEDPVFYEKFSALIRQTIDEFRQHRLSEKDYLRRVRELRDRVHAREDEDDPTPPSIRGNGHAVAFWGITRRELRTAGLEDGTDLAADIALKLTDIIGKHATVGWQNDRDIQNRIRNEADDFFFDEMRGRHGLILAPEVMDAILDDVLASARVRMAK
jgi:type I restriction enzyme R subunit